VHGQTGCHRFEFEGPIAACQLDLVRRELLRVVRVVLVGPSFEAVLVFFQDVHVAGALVVSELDRHDLKLDHLAFALKISVPRKNAHLHYACLDCPCCFRLCWFNRDNRLWLLLVVIHRYIDCEFC